jgi:hypothetical protein
VKFKSIPFSSYADTSLREKTEQQGRRSRQMGDCISSIIMQIVELKTSFQQELSLGQSAWLFSVLDSKKRAWIMLELT